MKTIKVTYHVIEDGIGYDPDIEGHEDVEAEIDFDVPLNIDDEDVLTAIQKVVDKYEDDGITIDQGTGEPEADIYELDLADLVDTQNEGQELADNLLHDVVESLANLVKTRAENKKN